MCIIPNLRIGERIVMIAWLVHFLRFGGSGRIYHHRSIELLSNSLCVPTYRWRRKLLDVVSSSHHADPYASPEFLRIWGKNVIIAWIAHFLGVGDSVRIYHHRSIELVSSSLRVHVYRWRRMLLDVVSPAHHAAPYASSRISENLGKILSSLHG